MDNWPAWQITTGGIHMNTSDEYGLDPALVAKLMAAIEAKHENAGTVPFREQRSSNLSFPTREEQRSANKQALAPIDTFQLITENAEAIKKYPQYRFTTSECRTF